MTKIRIPAAALAAALLAGACTSQPITFSAPNVVLPFQNLDEIHTDNRRDTSYIAPTDPRYAETGAPRAGEVTGETRAGAPWQVGAGRSYAPVPGNR